MCTTSTVAPEVHIGIHCIVVCCNVSLSICVFQLYIHASSTYVCTTTVLYIVYKLCVLLTVCAI